MTKLYINKPFQPRTTAIYDAYWHFATKRQNVFFERIASPEKTSWTSDSILNTYKFTNAYRASDRVSQYLIKNVIYDSKCKSYSYKDLFFRIILFKLFNKIETWEYLENALGHLYYDIYNFDKFNSPLNQLIENRQTIYSAAYIMPSGTSSFGYPKKHRNHLKLIEYMFQQEIPERISEARTMEEGYRILLSCPTIGSFLAYQLITDINYSELTNFSENEFVMPGPGAIDGISKCFSDTSNRSDSDIIKHMTDIQNDEFSRLNLDFKNLWGRPLQLIDCQNLFCEISKYSRISHPNIKGLSGRVRIKQKFTPKYKSIDYWYPPKWKINNRIFSNDQLSRTKC